MLIGECEMVLSASVFNST